MSKKVLTCGKSKKCLKAMTATNVYISFCSLGKFKGQDQQPATWSVCHMATITQGLLTPATSHI